MYELVTLTGEYSDKRVIVKHIPIKKENGEYVLDVSVVDRFSKLVKYAAKNKLSEIDYDFIIPTKKGRK